MRKPKYQIVLCMTALMASFLFGCGQNAEMKKDGAGETQQTKEADTADTTDSADTANAGGDVVLTVWIAKSFNPDADAAMQARFESFAEVSDKVSQVKVETFPGSDGQVKWNTAIESGDFPDVSFINDDVMQSYVEMGVLRPLDHIAEKVEANLGAMMPGSRDNLTFDGHLYGIPYSLSINMIHYRTDVFEEAGISVPLATWEQVEDACAVLKEKTDLYPIGLAISNSDDSETCNRWILKAFGGKYWDEEGNVIVNSKETVDAVNYLVNMYNQGYIPPSAVEWDSAGNNNSYLAGECAMVVNIPTLYNALQADDLKDTLGVNTGMMALPSGENFTPWSEPSNGSYSIFEGCKHPELSEEMLQYVFEDNDWYTNDYISNMFPVNIPTYENAVEGEVWSSELGTALMTTSLEEDYNHKFGWPCTDPVVMRADAQSEKDFSFSKTVLRVILDGMSPEDSVAQLEQELNTIKEQIATQ